MEAKTFQKILSAIALATLAGSIRASDWSEWKNAAGNKFIQYRFRLDETKHDAFGSLGFMQIRNSGREVADYQVRVTSTMLVSNDLGDNESDYDGHLRPSESTPEIPLGMIAKVESVKVTRYAGTTAEAEPAAPNKPKTVEAVLGASVQDVLAESKARQKKFNDLRSQTISDYAKMNAAFEELSIKDEKRKQAYAARVNQIENITMMMQQSQQNSFAMNSFAPRNSMVFSTTPLSELSNQLRQFNPELAEFNAFADLAKTLAQFDSTAFNQIEGGQAIVNSVSTIINLFGHKKDPEEERREKLEMMKKSKENFEVIQGNYDRAKKDADPKWDVLGNALITGDDEEFFAKFNALSKEDREKGLDSMLSDGDYLIHIASVTGNTKMIRFLKDQGCRLESEDAEGRTPLYRAVEANETEAAIVLMSLGADPKKAPLPKMANTEVMDSLRLAKKSKNPMMVRAIEKKIVPLSADQASLDICSLAREGNAAALKEKLAGSSPNVRDELGWTPLHHAIASSRLNPDSPNQIQTIQLLIDSGASLTATTLTGRSPLTLAVEKDMPLAFMALVRAGANPNAKDRAGNSAISLAKDLHRDAILLLLEKEGKKK